MPIIPLFAFSPTESPILTHHPAWILTLTQISLFLIQFPNSITHPSKPQTNLQPPNSVHQFFLNPFQPNHFQSKNNSPSTISHVSQVTPTYSPFTNERSSKNSPEVMQTSQELNNLIALQQQIQHPHTLTIHQLSSNITSPNPPTRTPSSDYTTSLAQSSKSTHSSPTTNREYKTFKRKFPNHPFPSKLGTARDYVNHPDHTNTPDFLLNSLPLFPQYTISYSNPHTEQRHYVDEHVLIPTLH